MVKEYGMSTRVGHVYFAREKRPFHVDMGFTVEAEYSEATSELIDTYGYLANIASLVSGGMKKLIVK